MKAHVIIYSKPGCHLCDEAKEVIEQSECRDDLTLEVINIEGEPFLFEKYKYDIPVVLINGVEAFRHSVDAKEFTQAVARTKQRFV